MSETQLVQFKLMLPQGLKRRVEQHAKRNRRSLSKEIVAALEDRYPNPPEESLSLADVYRMMEDVEAAGTEREADARLEEANELLRDSGIGLELRFSPRRDDAGRRELFMTLEGHGMVAR